MAVIFELELLVVGLIAAVDVVVFLVQLAAVAVAVVVVVCTEV